MSRLLPDSWLVPAAPARVIVHWTAGGYRAGEADRPHYHFLLQDGAALGAPAPVVAARGLWTVADNDTTRDGRYAAHTRAANSGSIGLAACCMRGAVQGKQGGSAPLTAALWEGLARAAAELCAHYQIPVTPRTVLQHGEVERVLGIPQRGKWDCCWLPWEPSLPAAEVCAQFRRKVQWYQFHG